ncbi:MAG: hypothetical protein WBL55_01115 [Xanthobacteraceae bacterium]
MHLDLQTISVATAFIVALLGAFLVFAGLQSRNVCAPIWWGSAHIVNACGFALLSARGSAPEFVTICIANALMLFGYGLTWTGARIFDGRPVRPSVVLVATLIWIALCRIPAFADDLGARIIVASTMLALLALLAAREFWLGRDEPLMSRWPLVVVFFPWRHVTAARARRPVQSELPRPICAEQPVIHLAGFRHAVVHRHHRLPAAQSDQGTQRASA